jgi:hypothetical protein
LTEHGTLTRVVAAAVFSLAAMCASVAFAQDRPPRLPITPVGPTPRDGLYMSPDDVEFMVDHGLGGTRLRFVGNDEIFYLSNDPAPMGGRVLRQDTGEVALTVSSWGGVTLYTRQRPSGIPAERTGDPPALEPKPVSGREAKLFAARLSQRLADRHNLAIGFAANWALLERQDAIRALAVDSMRNAAYALEDLAGTRGLRGSLAARINAVRVVMGAAKSTNLRNENGVQFLIVTFAPLSGPSARPSSLAISRTIMERLGAAVATQ